MVIASSGEGILPYRDPAVYHVDEAGLAPIRIRVHPDQTTSDGGRACIGVGSCEEQSAWPTLKEVVASATDAIRDPAVEIDHAGIVLGTAGLVSPDIQSANNAIGAGGESEVAADPQVIGAVFHLNGGISGHHHVIGNTNGCNHPVLAGAGLSAQLPPGKDQVARANQGVLIGNPQEHIWIEGGGARVGHRHIVKHRTATVIDHLIQA